MQSGVFAFVVVDVDGNFLDQVQGLAVGRLEVLQVRREDVVGFPGGNALGEFAHVVGIDFPLRFLVFRAADLYGDAVDRTIVGAPDGAGDQSVGLAFGFGSREEAFAES